MKRLPIAGLGLLVAASLGATGCSSARTQTAAVTPTPASSLSADLAAAREYEKQGFLTEAAVAYRELHQRDPNSPQYLHRLAVIETRQGKYEEADGHYQQALALDPENATLLSDMGYSAFLAQDLEASEEHLRAAVQLRPDDQRAIGNLGTTLAYAGQFDEAIACFRQVMPEGQALETLAGIHEARGETDLAVQKLTQALDANPESTAALESLSRLVREHQQKFAARPAAPSQPSVAPQNMGSDFAWAGGTASEDASIRLTTGEGQTKSRFADTTVEVDENPFADSSAPTLATAEEVFESPIETADNTPVVNASTESNVTDNTVTIENVWQDAKEVSPTTDLSGVESLTGFKGYCPVTLRNERKLVPSIPQYAREFEGTVYQFASLEAAEAFAKAPEHYAPAASGLDVVAVHSGLPVAFGSIDHGAWFRGRLYLFSSVEHLEEFRLNPTGYLLH